MRARERNGRIEKKWRKERKRQREEKKRKEEEKKGQGFLCMHVFLVRESINPIWLVDFICKFISEVING